MRNCVSVNVPLKNFMGEFEKEMICRAAETGTFLIERSERILVRVLPTALARRLREDTSQGQTVLKQNIDRAWIQGDLEKYTLAAGQVAGLVHEVKTVREIVEEMVSPAEA